MVLKSVKPDVEVSGSTVTEVASKDVLLELAFYRRYMRLDKLYEGNTVYKFSQEQAVLLLTETDGSRSVWRVYRPKTVRHKAVQVTDGPQPKRIVDATKQKVAAIPRSDEFDDSEEQPHRIDIGNDEEIESILNSGDVVTV